VKKEDKMFYSIMKLIVDDPDVLKPFLGNLSNKDILFLRERIPFEDIEELSDGHSNQEIKAFLHSLSGSEFLDIFLKYAKEEYVNLVGHLPEETIMTLCQKIPREELITWTDSQPSDLQIKALKEMSPEDVKLFALFQAITENKFLGKEKEELKNLFRETWFYFDRTQIRDYPPEMAIGLPHFIKTSLERSPPWSNDPEDLEEHWREHRLGDWRTHMARNWELEPPYIREGIKIPEKIRELYAETRCCYIYGQFRASVAMSRAVVEAVLKDKLKLDIKKKYGAGDALHDALRSKVITQDTYSLGDNIICKANDILHKAIRIKESNALKFLDDAKKFLESIYKK